MLARYEGRPFIIMRLLKGGTLREQIGKPGFDLSALIRGLEEIGDALAAAHARHIIHRDIKPGNILYDEHGSAFLSDFGIAKVLDSATQLTGSGFIGTPAYMSPEQFIGQSIDGRSDQYALAVVVFEALTGSLPFQGNTAQMMYKHINAPPPAIDLDEHPIPSSFNPVLQKSLAKNPADRYARILDFTTALRIALRQDPTAAALPLAIGVGLVPTPQKPITAPTQIDTPPEEKKTDLLQQDYREGLEAMSRSQWTAALTAFNRVLDSDPNYGNAAEFKQQAEVNLSQAAINTPAVEEIMAVDPGPEKDGHGLAAAAAVGLAAAGAAALTPDLDETSVDLPAEPAGGELARSELVKPVKPVEAPFVAAAEDDLEKTSLDLPPGAMAAAGAVAIGAAAQDDLEKTSLDLPSGAFDAGTAAPYDLDKTSVDLPTGAVAAASAAAAGASTGSAADLDKTSLDLPPGAFAAAGAAAGAAAVPPPASAGPARSEPVETQKKKSGLPIWAIAAGIIILLLLCGGGAYAAVNMFGSTNGGDGNVAGDSSGSSGGVIAASAGQGNPEPVAAVAATATELPDTAVPEPTEEPLTEPTQEPSPEPEIIVEDTEVPPTPTDEPTETPAPETPLVRVSVSSANLRGGPGVLYRVLKPVFENDQMELVAKNRDASWFLVLLEDGTLGWLSSTVVAFVNDAGPDKVEVAATIPVAPTLTPVPPTNTPLPRPTLPPPPPTEPSGGGSGGGGGGGGDDGGSKPPPVYTAEPP